MKVILALGNPGEKYVHTRHNAGFLVIDQLAAEQGAQFSNKPKFFADIAELNSFTVDSAASTNSHTIVPREKILPSNQQHTLTRFALPRGRSWIFFKRPWKVY